MAIPRIDFAIGVIEARAKQIRGLSTWPLYYDEAQQAYDIISEL